MTWNDIAIHFPEFVAWCVANDGPLPDGPVQESDYNRLKAAFEEAE